MRDLNSLGIRHPRYRKSFPPITDAGIRAFERYFGINLPADYVEFLHFTNGGTPRTREYDDPVTGGVGGFDYFYGLGSAEENERIERTGKWDYGNLWGETRSFNRHLLTGDRTFGVPFAADGGGNTLFFDYRQASRCVSQFVLATRLTYQLFPTFSDFLDMLHPPTPIPRTGSHEVVMRIDDVGADKRGQSPFGGADKRDEEDGEHNDGST